jgi:hypothetical protein
VSDPLTATLGKEAIDQASGLVVRWLDSVNDRDDQLVGRILYEPTLALARMRTYCNAARLIHVPLQGFSAEWPEERRHQLRDAWIPWRSIFDILPSLEAVTDTLYLREVRLPSHWWQFRKDPERDRQTLAALQTELAGTLAMFLNDVACKIASAKIYVIPSDFDNDDQSIQDYSNLVLSIVQDPGRSLVARARTTVIRLRETVLSQRPGLPQEIWQPLNALAFGS